MHKPSALVRIVSQWCNRLLGAARERSFHEEDEVYEANQTSRDYLWNTISMGMWGVVFPFLTIVVTQLSGTELAGMFSMAFVVANLLMILANFGIRTFQVSDVAEVYSFSDYQVNRVITCVAAVIAAVLYCQVRGYDAAMSTLCVSLVVYKAFDGLADVYEGRLQQVGKMYLGGVSLFVRSLLAFVTFCLALLLTGSLPTAGIVMAVFAGASTLVVTIPLAYFESERSARLELSKVVSLFKHSWPLFVALFMYSLVDNMPKFVMEGILSYDNQLYYNVLYFPAMFILMTAQTVYKPMLVGMANVWHNPEKRRRFDAIIGVVILGIVALTAVTCVVMLWIGLRIFSFLYGIDFSQFQEATIIMLISGGITAGIDFLYQVITILRRQRDVIMAYVVSFILALFTPMLLIRHAGLDGAVISYLITMSVLFILMLWIYFRIRFDKSLGKMSGEGVAGAGTGDGGGSAAGAAGAAGAETAGATAARARHANTAASSARHANAAGNGASAAAGNGASAGSYASLDQRVAARRERRAATQTRHNGTRL